MTDLTHMLGRVPYRQATRARLSASPRPRWLTAATGLQREVYLDLLASSDQGGAHLWCAGLPGAQQELVASAPGRFFRPPYVDGSASGWTATWTGRR